MLPVLSFVLQSAPETASSSQISPSAFVCRCAVLLQRFVCIVIHTVDRVLPELTLPAGGEFRPRQSRQLPRAVDLKGRFLFLVVVKC
jgi:hypothetical protein